MKQTLRIIPTHRITSELKNGRNKQIQEKKKQQQ